jgi:hypothetical protein
MIPIEGIDVIEITQRQQPIGRWIALVFVSICFIIVLYAVIRHRALSGIPVLGLCLLCIAVCAFQINEGPYTEYKVYVKDYAALAEVAENYEIIRSEGNIYCLRDKEK